MPKTLKVKKPSKPPAKPQAEATRASDKARELTDAELDKVAGGVGVVKRTRR